MKLKLRFGFEVSIAFEFASYVFGFDKLFLAGGGGGGIEQAADGGGRRSTGGERQG